MLGVGGSVMFCVIMCICDLFCGDVLICFCSI